MKRNSPDAVGNLRQTFRLKLFGGGLQISGMSVIAERFYCSAMRSLSFDTHSFKLIVGAQKQYLYEKKQK
jgi:hypothetical protein